MTSAMTSAINSVINSAINSECKTRKGSRHDKTGCLTCRHRRKKCVDNAYPSCGTCLRLNLECVREPKRNVVPGTRPDQRPAGNTIQLNYPPIPAISWSRHKRRVMGHYITVLTAHLSVSEQFNSFLSAILPMAMESAALSDALAAFASGHLALMDKDYTLPALDAQTTAIRNLAAAINAPSDGMSWHEINAAACLTFVISEIGVGDCRGWYNHLQGAKYIILSASTSTSKGSLYGPEAFKTTTEGQWMLRNFAYHDIIGSVTLRRKPLMSGDYLHGITDVVDSSLGVATGLLILLAKLIDLDEDTTTDECLSDIERQERRLVFHTTCASIQQQLLSWRCHPDTLPGLKAVAYAYRSAILIFLYRLLRSRLASLGRSCFERLELQTKLHGKIDAQVESILVHVSNIAVGTSPESALLFPLFMAGGEAKQASIIDTIRQRLRMAFSKRQFQNVSRALKVLEDLWDLRKHSNGANVDWTHILKASGQELLLT